MMVTRIRGTSNFVIDSTATTPATSRTTSPKFTSFLSRDIDKSDPKSTPPMIAREILLRINIASGTTAPQTSDTEVDMDPREPPKSIVVTRQEILTLTSVLGRIPHFPNEALRGNAGDIRVDVVEDPPQSPTRRLQASTSAPDSDLIMGEAGLQSREEDTPARRGKRQRPKYVLKSNMLRKHPVLKLFGTH